jgi:hypothetical protein
MQYWVAAALLMACTRTHQQSDVPDAAPDGGSEPSCQLAPPTTYACGTSSSTSAAVRALVGDAPAVGASVASSRVDGTVIEQVVADANGCATVTSEPGAEVSVVFGDAYFVHVITTLAPTSGQLEIHSFFKIPPPPTPPCDPVRITVDASTWPANATAGIDIDLGVGPSVCPVHLGEGGAPPFTYGFPISRECVGTQGQIDLQVSALGPSSYGPNPEPAPVAYAAGRVSVIGDLAHFVPTTWSTPTASKGPCPVQADSALGTVTSSCSYEADGFVFDRYIPSMTVDHTRARVDLDSGRRVYIQSAGAPTTITVLASDFLPAIPTIDAISDLSTMHLHWSADVPASDAVRLKSFWAGSNDQQVTWDLVLPATATDAVLPAIQAPGLVLPDRTQTLFPATVDREYLDDDAIQTFDDVLARGIHLETEDPLADDPVVGLTDSRVRVTRAPAH